MASILFKTVDGSRKTVRRSLARLAAEFVRRIGYGAEDTGSYDIASSDGVCVAHLSPGLTAAELYQAASGQVFSTGHLVAGDFLAQIAELEDKGCEIVGVSHHRGVGWDAFHPEKLTPETYTLRYRHAQHLGEDAQ